jgi:microcystin-dependent protein
LAVVRRPRYPTPDNTPGVTTRSVSIPFSMLYYVSGLFFDLAEADRWEQIGDMTPQECAALFLEMAENMTNPIGEIRSTVGGIPSFGLAMDGSIRAMTTYPELWDVIPEVWKNPDDTFTLPNLDGSFLMGGSPIGAIGGEASHALDLSEIPSHAHTTHYHNPAGLGGDIPGAASGYDIAGDTGSSGGSLAHNNLPPYMRVTFYIVAR